MAGWLDTGVVTDVLEVGQGPIGDEVPAAWAPDAGSAAERSPPVADPPPPMSMKRERSFISRAWMSSGLPWDSLNASHLASHSPQCVCVCPGSAAVCGWEWTKVGWTEGTLVVTGWSPTMEEEEEGGVVVWKEVGGVSCGPGMAVVRMTEEEREAVEEEGGDTDGCSEETSLARRVEEGGEDTGVWAGGGEVSSGGGRPEMLAGGKGEGADVAMTG